MELKTYLRILIKKWWIVVPVFLLTLLLTYVYTNNQPTLYDTDATFVMRPRASTGGDGSDVVKLVDTLSRHVEINTTYAEVVKSALIKTAAADRLGLSSAELSDMSVSSKVIPGTNILQITVKGMNPTLIKEFADAIGAETLAYIDKLYDVFDLEPLDAAQIPKNPFSPNRELNLIAGAVLGLMLGIVLVFLFEYLLAPTDTQASFDIVDSESGAFSRAFFLLRLQQEMSRSERHGYPMSVALIQVNRRGLSNGAASGVSVEALRAVASMLQSNVREEDILARYEHETFALLLPDIAGELARLQLETLRIKVTTTPLSLPGSTQKLFVHTAIGAATYDNYDIDADALMAQTAYALKEASGATYGTVGVAQVSPNPNATLQVPYPADS